jgi:hypothetical protein
MHKAIACICTAQLASLRRTPLMTDTDRMQALGHVTDIEGSAREVFRDYDSLHLPQAVLGAAGVTELERKIAEFWQELACYRLRTADLSAIDLAEARQWLAELPGTGDPADLESVDWLEVGTRLKALEQYSGFGELRRLHALLTGTETPKEA